MTAQGYWKRKVIEPIRALLRQGLSPHQLALSTVAGAWFGVMPVLGVTTALCTAVALLTRLNLLAIQAVNWAVYPLQIVLLYPFFLLGARLHRVDAPPVDPSTLTSLFRDDWRQAIALLGNATLHALSAWLLIGLPLALAAYFVLVPIFRRAAMRIASRGEKRP